MCILLYMYMYTYYTLTVKSNCMYMYMHVHILTITVYLYLHVQLQRQNDREAKSIDSIFAEKQEKVELIRELEREIDEEKRAAEHVVGSMENEMLEKYHTLKAENTRIEKVPTCA